MFPLPLLPFISQDALAEAHLINKHLIPEVYQRLEIGTKQIKWGREGVTGYTPHKLMFVHVWAVECRPCIEELPAIRKLLESFRVQNVHPVYVVETIAKRDVEDFYKTHPQFFADGADHYYGPDVSTREYFEVSAQPLSLFVDGNTKKIKRAFVGSILNRQKEVASVAEQLRLIAYPPPPQVPPRPPAKAPGSEQPPPIHVANVPMQCAASFDELQESLKRQDDQLKKLVQTQQELLTAVTAVNQEVGRPQPSEPPMLVRIQSIENNIARLSQTTTSSSISIRNYGVSVLMFLISIIASFFGGLAFVRWGNRSARRADQVNSSKRSV